MMRLKELELLFFKNHAEKKLTFNSRVICLVGPNGIGKTNLLDAVYCLCLTKSAFSSVESMNVQHEMPYCMIKGVMEKEGETMGLAYQFQKNKPKVFTVDKLPYERLTEHIGKFPCVLIAPDDTEVIREGSEVRRRFFDGILSQTDNEYLKAVLQYGYYLKQRNALLKQMAETHVFDHDLLDSYTFPLIQHGTIIAEKRIAFLEVFQPLFQTHYKQLSGGNEEVSLTYSCGISEVGITQQMKENVEKDRVLQRTTSGVHKDDYIFQISGFPLKKYGSQGQQKTYLLALKLAQYDFLKEKTHQKPILLMDDIFDKLDDHRIEQMLEMIATDHFGQVFITDARPERSASLLKKISIDAEVHTLDR